ncbi:ABC transporter substrate-binding protein [Roseibium marinum]|uniref:NitT/TauT family transport system substrate-binding protein n=1 Tax=Roseibium marinum TaxID=281252 RepID=A0A2S3UTN4_9HYPH|nr:ABC transporter substrate-binding protein [Roseibium marinum]POF30829.1 NitT/TauT family transport system substrate-binding protein [Roseibium marinum]
MALNKLKALAAAAIAAAGTVTTAQAADTVTFQLDWLPGGDKAPVYVCIEKGFCAEEGIEVKIEPGRGSSEAITKLATGVSDIGSADIGALMAAKVTEGVPVTAVMSIFNKGPHAFFVLKDSGIEKIEDIKGKEVATSPFTSSNVFLPLVLEDVGLSEDDIKLTKADPGALGPMLMTGSADVIVAWMTNVAIFTNQASQAGKEIMPFPWDAAGLELYSASLLASDKFLDERPEVAKRFVKAFKKSLEYVKENPTASAEAMVSQVPELTVADVEGAIIDTMVLEFNDVSDKDGVGVLMPERLSATWDRVSAAQGLDKEALDLETVVDRSFLPEN